MNVQTFTLLVSAPRDTVFNFLADIENLPRWATGFCERLYLERGRWKALTSQGELYCDLEAGNSTGVIDLRTGPSVDRLAVLPMRVVALAPRRTLVTFTFMAGPEWPVGLAERDPAVLHAELTALARRFGGGEVHGPDAVPALVELGHN